MPTPSTEQDIDLLRVTGLTKRYGPVTALDDVSLAIRRGEILGLIGPNGSGKTTLFECVAGMLACDAGVVTDGNGRSLRGASLSRQIFYLPDGVAPWPHETVRWVLDAGVAFFEGAAERLPQVVGALGLGPLLGVRMGALSKGQRKRALLGLGLLTPQPLLLADEPFEGLDLRQTRELGRILRTEAARGRTLFLSIHQIADAARVCDRFVLISEGRIRGIGTLNELVAHAAAEGCPPTAPDLEEVVLALT